MRAGPLSRAIATFRALFGLVSSAGAVQRERPPAAHSLALPPGSAPVDVVPPEILLQILSYLSVNELLSCVCRVSKTWRDLCYDDTLWRYHMRETLGITCNVAVAATARQAFLHLAELAWDDRMADEAIMLTNWGRTAADTYRRLHTAWRTVLAKRRRHGGSVRYIEVHVDHCHANNDYRIMFGVTDDRSGYVHRLVRCNESLAPFGFDSDAFNSWTYWANGTIRVVREAASGHFIRGATSVSTVDDTFEPYTSGDDVGVSIDIVGRTISFYRNGRRQGGPFDYNGSPRQLLVAVSLINGNAVTINAPPRYSIT